MVDQTEDIQKIHHYMDIELNIQTWNLLEKRNRSEKDNERMLNYAKSSHYHWKRPPQFKPVNQVRGNWLISHVYAVLGYGKKAQSFAKKALKLTNDQNLIDYDLAYAYEAMARANAALGNEQECKKGWNKAKNAGDNIQDQNDKKYFFSDLNTKPWFNYI